MGEQYLEIEDQGEKWHVQNQCRLVDCITQLSLPVILMKSKVMECPRRNCLLLARGHFSKENILKAWNWLPSESPDLWGFTLCDLSWSQKALLTI